MFLADVLSATFLALDKVYNILCVTCGVSVYPWESCPSVLPGLVIPGGSGHGLTGLCPQCIGA